MTTQDTSLPAEPSLMLLIEQERTRLHEAWPDREYTLMEAWIDVAAAANQVDTWSGTPNASANDELNLHKALQRLRGVLRQP